MIVFIPATESISHLVGTSQSHVASFAGASTLFLRALNAQVAEALGPLLSFWSFCWSWQRWFSWLLGA